jgi:hypothetical protein
MTARNDHHSDYGLSQLVLFGVAVILLLAKAGIRSGILFNDDDRA